MPPPTRSTPPMKNPGSATALTLERTILINPFISEHPYEDALGKRNLPPDVYTSIEDPEAEACGFADKYEVEAVRKYLWKHGFVLKLVIRLVSLNHTVIIPKLYSYHIHNSVRLPLRNHICVTH